jgi:copper transport protein
LRSANYLALMLAVGCVGILLWVLPAGAAIEEAIAGVYTSARRRIFALTTGAAAGAFMLGLAQIAWQARLLAENLPQGTPVLRLAGQLALQWPWGVAWIGRQIAWLAFFALALWGWRVEKAETNLDPQSLKGQKARVWLLAVLAGAAVLCQSFSSHAAALERPATPLLVDALHLIVAGLWIGGLAALAVGLLPLLLRDRTGFNDVVRRIWGPFSRLAAVSVGLLFASGLYSTAHEVISADALLLSPYGKLLSSKVALVLLAGLVGLLNSTLLHPQLAAPLRRVLHKPAGWTAVSMQRFPLLVLLEVSLGLVIVGLVGFLTSQPPAENIAYALSPDDQPADVFQLVNDLFVTLTIKPNRPGTNVILINVANTRRPPPAEILRVIVRMTYLEKDVGVISQDAELTGTLAANDSYRLATRSLTQPGHWAIDVIVRRKGLPDSQLTVPWTVLAVEDTGPVRISRSRWQNTLVAVALGLGLVVILLALLIWRRER